jgi:hydrogenase maturation protease
VTDDHEPRRRIAVYGIGNTMRGDDAVGLVVARRLKEMLPEHVEVREHGDDCLALLDLWERLEEAVVVDAMLGGKPAGTIFVWDASDRPLPSEGGFPSTHAFGLAEAIQLGRVLRRLPKRLMVYGIQGRSFAPGAGLTPAVERAADRLARLLLRSFSSGRGG